MSESKVTTHSKDYTFSEYMDDLLERVTVTQSLSHERIIDLPNGRSVTLHVRVVEVALSGEASASLH